MKTIPVRRHEVTFQPESARVIIRPFIPSSPGLVDRIIKRALDLSEGDVATQTNVLYEDFGPRHFDIQALWMAQFEKVKPRIFAPHLLSSERRLLIGALFSGEYALESAALFNPSIVPHPDQNGVAEGDLRFIMSLRATGEGHISSIEFRTGIIHRRGGISVEPVSRFVTVPQVLPNPSYYKSRFIIKLQEMGLESSHGGAVMDSLEESFTLQQLEESVRRVRQHSKPLRRDLRRTLECIRWLADSNYELRFPSHLAISERIIFPVSPNESNGIEDARFVRFQDAGGTPIYYATYTAYNGRVILPQFIETIDFLHFRVLTLNGNAVQNKGMALFPRKIGGRYVMLSRQDDENLFVMFSDNPHYWNDPVLLMRPKELWESVKVGNCGSPIETDAGWLVITHGVGPMRKYCIGALLLDLDDPRKVLGRLKEPLLAPENHEREGYVPNVVYSCGALLHHGEIILPYAISDKATIIATVSVHDLLAAMSA
jgi:predicted GH43/DUF377 family glycosyl hydrolase